MKGCCTMGGNMIPSGTYNNLGQFDPISASAITGGIFKWAEGLFSKAPEKTQYDSIRQQAWDSLVQIVDVHENYKGNAELTRSVDQDLINTITKLMDGFKRYTDGMIAKYPSDSAWITPRFHDYYDQMNLIRSQYQQEMATLPADYIGEGVDFIKDLFGSSNVSPVTLPTFPNSPTMSPMPSSGIQKSGFDTSSMLLIGGVVVGAILLMSNRKRG